MAIKNNRGQAKKDINEALGPVDDLESYVKAEWWREIFNANYLRTDGDVVEDQHITEKEVSSILDILKMEPSAKILDLCCGQGRHTLELARRGFKHVSGFDRSHYLINRAKTINKKEGLGVTFKEGDARKLSYASDSFDYVLILGNSFGYFESLEDDVCVLNEVIRILKPDGRLLIDITDGAYMKESFQPRSWEWIDKQYFVCRERSLSADQNRLISREVITHVRKGVVADQFYAERLYTEQDILQLIKQVGMQKGQLHPTTDTVSTRNQDLGMMQRRMIITAMTNKNWSPLRKPRKNTKTVAVLMGDPSKKDIVKPNASFGEDDFDTINKLKRALSLLSEYNFQFYDQHNTLIQDIAKKKGKFEYIFNLCDEGYNNKATWELHIPALLEVLDIPYTGGGPQCLAYCYDKSLVRGIANEMDIPVPQAFLVKPEDTFYIDLTIDFPVIVKPNSGDSSFGITKESVCYNVENLEHALMRVRDKMGYDQPVLVEQFLPGKDISVGIIGNPPDAYHVLPIIQEDYSKLPEELPHICGYEAKWDTQSPYAQVSSIPANLSEEAERFLIASCIKLFTRLGCRDYARFDWRADENGTPRLLEVNPNPGWCWDGHLAKMAALSGIDYSNMLLKILNAAEQRLEASRKTQTEPEQELVTG